MLLWIAIAIYVIVAIGLVAVFVKKEWNVIFTDDILGDVKYILSLIGWPLVLAGIVVWAILTTLFEEPIDYLQDVWKHGGFKKRREFLARQAAEEKRREALKKAEEEEYERIKKDYLDGKLTRTELPRMTDGEHKFEFNPELCLSSNYASNVRELVYVERERSEVLNSFFERHKGLQLYYMYRLVYLPHFIAQLDEGEQLSYLFPHLDPKDYNFRKIDSVFPLDYMAYPEDREKIGHGMMLFYEGMDNHGAPYICGSYYPLSEGSDEDIIRQLHEVVNKAHVEHSHSVLYQKMKRPEIEEGSTKDYADELFMWVAKDNEVALLVKEIRERVEELHRRGLGSNLIKKLIREEPKFSRLVVTEDYRIVLPDYHDMEIKMEPLVKAVYLLFLRHPEGIIFKHLPDYRGELADIYSRLRPNGLTTRALGSIEDVTNPCLNSINEKCARIRGAFITQFDEELARSYYVDGRRGEAKGIALSRDLVEWENSDD